VACCSGRASHPEFAAQHTPRRRTAAAGVKLYWDNATTLPPDPVHSRFMTRLPGLRQQEPGQPPRPIPSTAAFRS
jgi:hypothetical protein